MHRKIKLIFNVFLIFSIIFILFFLNSLIKFSNQIGQPANYFFKTIYQAAQENPYQDKDKINFLILGEDKRDDLLEKTEATDTIIFASLNLKDFKFNMISLPRDLWSYPLEAKINDIYPQSLQQADKFPFIKNKFQEIINQPIDHVLVLSTDNLIEFVTLIDGVDVDLQEGFTDDQYPNPDYIDNPDDSSVPIYKTISFASGTNHLDESNITEFVRSRKSSPSVSQGGTDIGRIQRQQLLIEAIVDKLRNKAFIVTDSSQIIGLYKLWNQKIVKDFSDTNLLQLVTTLNDNFEKITLNKVDLPIGENAKDGVIYHPYRFINNQWVFIPSDKEYQQLQDFVQKSIN
jgi:anionic cell wall polymer biosynthesis LytR-Cps2A-Psr (LCP) family protein